jgi:hypothetical protein
MRTLWVCNVAGGPQQLAYTARELPGDEPGGARRRSRRPSFARGGRETTPCSYSVMSGVRRRNLCGSGRMGRTWIEPGKDPSSPRGCRLAA